MTNHAETAKEIRKVLKAKFPETKFSIRSKSYSGGNDVNVYWTDGPLASHVDMVINNYQMGHFDGMIDCYEYSNRNDTIPQVKFVFSNRTMSEKIEAEIIKFIRSTYADCEDFNSKKYYTNWNAYGSTLIYREFVKKAC